MRYFFVLGGHPSLSIAEIFAFFGRDKIKDFFLSSSGEVFSAEIDGNIGAEDILYQLAGTVKIGEVFDELDAPDNNIILDNIFSFLSNILNTYQGKFNFGLSCYGLKNFDPKSSGLEIKKNLRADGASIRLAYSGERALSSVAVSMNKLDRKGAEIIVFNNGQKVYLGRTISVQPFRELSFRDYGRPCRDDRSGMIPPKLAQIMLNLALPGGDFAGKSILDPFCGSGTVLAEAALFGLKKLYGSDLSAKAAGDTQENIHWIAEKYKLENLQIKIVQADVKNISTVFKGEQIDGIATEPYLGPQRGSFDQTKITRELEYLYSQALKEFEKIIKKGSRVVMIWPIFKQGGKNIFLNINLDNWNSVKYLPDSLIASGVTPRDNLVYGREGQKVWREIIILEKK